MSMGRSSKYQPTGCRFHDNCLSCPFADCLLDSGVHFNKMLRKQRVAGLLLHGLSDQEVAEKVSISVRTIQRCRKEANSVPSTL